MEQRVRRLRRVRRDWMEIVRLQEESGLSARAYCLRESIDPGSFYKWRGQIQKVALLSPSPSEGGSRGAFIDIGRIGSMNGRSSSGNGPPLEVTLDFGEGFTLTVRRS
jgi:hypothetical protein